MFGMLTGVGLSNLRHVDLQQFRNQMILGVSLYLGLAIPNWLETGDNGSMIKNLFSESSGLSVLNGVIYVLLNNSMFLGGLVCCVLDNCLKGSSDIKSGEGRSEEYKPGSRIELENSEADQTCEASKTYDLPFKTPRALKFLPIS